jgi:hypothetical protein
LCNLGGTSLRNEVDSMGLLVSMEQLLLGAYLR